MKRRRNKPNETTKLKSKNVTNDNNKIIIKIIKKNVKRNLWKILKFRKRTVSKQLLVIY